MNIDPALVIQVAVVALGVLAFVAVWRRGCLRRTALVEGPERPTGLHPVDLLVVVVLMLVGGYLSVVVLDYLFGGPVVPARLTTLEHAGMVLVYQALGQGLAVAYVLVRVIAAGGGGGGGGWGGVRALGFTGRQPGRQVWLTGMALLLGLPMLLALGVVVQWLTAVLNLWAPEVAHELLVAMRDADSLAGQVALLFAVVVVAAVLEEVIYRGLVQSALLRWLGPGRRWTVVFIATVIFVFMHVGPGTFDPDAEGGVTWNALPTLVVLSLILGWLYERTGSLWPPILVHAGFNAFNVALVLLLFE